MVAASMVATAISISIERPSRGPIMSKTLLIALVFIAIIAPPAHARKWSDATGNYSFEGDLLGINDATVVVQKSDKKRNLVAVPINQLSKADQEYLKSKEAADEAQRVAGQQQTWTMRGGLKVAARAVDYGRRDVTIQRRRSKIHVNDRLFDNLSAVQQKIVLKIVSHFEKTPIEDRRALEQWAIRLKASPKTFTVDGVLLELENGDVYGVPFFLFSDDDLKVLQPGWQRWLAAHEAREQKEQAQAEKEHEALLLQAQAEAYQRDRETDRQMRMLDLQLQAVMAGLTAIWEVELFPRGNFGGHSRIVVVAGRNSEDAARAALERFPNHMVGGIARVSR
jgi:hypothetical protein